LFFKFLLHHFRPSPAFVISDRDKDFMKGMQTTASGVPHFFFFRHMSLGVINSFLTMSKMQQFDIKQRGGGE
ncbi:unnamed protein product, partial [Albugo candida]